MDDHEIFMARAMDLARGPEFTSPNPRVGAVVVKDGRVVAAAAHGGAGTPHAEAQALEGVDAAGATLYVNLEPCSHTGRTPPCAPLVAASGIERVVVANVDPDPRVAGAGLSLLRKRGVAVDVGVLAEEGRRLNLGYLHQRRTGRPLVRLKLALSLDGRLAAPDGGARWITGPSARRAVHRRRLQVDGILVGAGTALADDPSLNVRDVPAARQPARVVVDSTGSLPRSAALLGAGSIVFTTERAPHEVQTSWKETGAEVVIAPAGDRGVQLDWVIEDLARRGWTEVLCEGGAELATSLLKDDLIDVVEVHYGPLFLGAGGPALGDLGVATMTDAARWSLLDVERAGDDVCAIYERPARDPLASEGDA